MAIKTSVYRNTARPKNNHDMWHVKITNGVIVEFYRFATEPEAHAFLAKMGV